MLSSWRVQAVLFYSTADPAKNITAPDGELTDSGWQFQGFWRSFTGTPIGPYHFVTARHVGGVVGGLFTLDGTSYTTVARTSHPEADLTVWEVAERFPRWARLYTATDEVGKPLVVYGRGRKRGTEVAVEAATPTPLRGWLWGSGDGGLRWGENVVEGTIGASPDFPTETLFATFDRGAGDNEATLATGDSGGAVFLRDGPAWKLAGINLAVDGYFSYTGEASTWFSAALFDAGGLYLGSNASSTYLEDTEADRPARFYAARISAYADWIRSVAPLPEPPSLLGVVSRMTQGAAGTFDVPLPTSPPLGIECRLATTLLLVFTFNRELSEARVEVQQGSLRLAEASVTGPQLFVRCEEVANAQWITLRLRDVTDTDRGLLEMVPVTFAVLHGDVTGNGLLTSGDVSAVKHQIGSIVHAGNFRADVTGNGLLTSGDVSAVKARIGTLLP